MHRVGAVNAETRWEMRWLSLKVTKREFRKHIRVSVTDVILSQTLGSKPFCTPPEFLKKFDLPLYVFISAQPALLKYITGITYLRDYKTVTIYLQGVLPKIKVSAKCMHVPSASLCVEYHHRSVWGSSSCVFHCRGDWCYTDFRIWLDQRLNNRTSDWSVALIWVSKWFCCCSNWILNEL